MEMITEYFDPLEVIEAINKACSDQYHDPNDESLVMWIAGAAMTELKLQGKKIPSRDQMIDMVRIQMNNEFKLNLKSLNSEFLRTFNYNGRIKKVVLDFKDNSITGTTFDRNGQPVDSFEIK